MLFPLLELESITVEEYIYIYIYIMYIHICMCIYMCVACFQGACPQMEACGLMFEMGQRAGNVKEAFRTCAALIGNGTL